MRQTPTPAQSDQARAGSAVRSYWTPVGRCVAFVLASSSIACLLSDFYRLCPMRWFTVFIFLPAMVVLFGLSCWDSLRNDGQLARAVLIGVAGGLIAAIAYDVFRLPFVFARQWGIAAFIPPMNLFKVFPGFGAMILGQPVEQAHYSTSARVLGWAYHFSNGATFGVMYMAMLGDARRRHWAWAILFAVALETGMLLTPYTKLFDIDMTARFVAVTLAAHAIFGVGLGLSARWLSSRLSGLQVTNS